jgi:hypothetical protein
VTGLPASTAGKRNSGEIEDGLPAYLSAGATAKAEAFAKAAIAQMSAKFRKDGGTGVCGGRAGEGE